MPIISALVGANAAKKASKAQVQAQREAIDFAREQSNLIRGDFQPYREAGAKGITPYLDALGANGATGREAALANFRASPGYDFRLGEGVRALDNSAASRGMLLSGAQLKGLTDYGQGVASEEWGNYLQGLQNLTGMGQASAAQTTAGVAPLNQSTLQSISNIGDARAAGIIGKANAWQNGIGQTAGLVGRLFGLG